MDWCSCRDGKEQPGPVQSSTQVATRAAGAATATTAGISEAVQTEQRGTSGRSWDGM